MGIPSPQEFVRLVTDRLGTDDPRAIARTLKLSDYDAPQRVRRWLKGRNGPNYEGTMLLLEAIGALQLDGDQNKKSTPASIGQGIRDFRVRRHLTVEQLARYAADAADANGWEQRDWAAAIRRLEESNGHYVDEREEHVVDLALIVAAKEHPADLAPGAAGAVLGRLEALAVENAALQSEIASLAAELRRLLSG